MKLRTHRNVVLLWIESCQTCEQLDWMVKSINDFVIKRFEGKVSLDTLELVKLDLFESIANKRTEIALANYKYDNEFYNEETPPPFTFNLKAVK